MPNVMAALNFVPGKILLRARAPENVYIVPAKETDKHRAKFGWLPLSNVAAVKKPRRKTRSNLLGCPKLTNRAQLLMVGRS